MFYQCPKCKKIWQYSIEKCPDCFLEPERIKTEKAKVIGVSKTSIPTLFHPKVPYFVLLLEDEKGNKWAQKSIREYKIGESFEIKTSRDKNAVAVWRVKYDILEAIEKVFELIGVSFDINKNSKILVLPTLVSPVHPHFAENTSPDVLGVFLKFLIGKGAAAKNIKVAGQSFTEIPIEAAAQKSGLLNVCLKNQVSLLNLAKTEFSQREKAGLNFEISKEVFNQDFIINLPTLNLDSRAGIRGATENLTRFLKKESYFALKYLHGEEKILESITSILPDNLLNIADGISVQKTNKIAVFLGLILGGFNPLNLDRIFTEICMIGSLPEYLKKIKIDDILVAGREIGEVQFEVERV